jgi:predicted ATPase with chaperone activity
MIGPPGTGKTLLAKRLPTILPPLTPAESLETTRISSARGRLQPGQSLMAGSSGDTTLNYAKFRGHHTQLRRMFSLLVSCQDVQLDLTRERSVWRG